MHSGESPFRRASGLLLHPASLPGRFGIGDLGPQARAFAAFLASARQRLWQVLPLGPTGYADSPYQCFSAFAGNPLLISPEDLEQQGLLTASELRFAELPGGPVDFAAVIARKLPLLDRAFTRLANRGPFDDFRRRNASWLEDFALFMAVKEEHGGVSWLEWEPGIRLRHPEALALWRTRLERLIDRHAFRQWLFFEQWTALRAAAAAQGVRMMGDIPIYVAADSSDVWTRRELFHLDEQGRPAAVAGVPPDYFSATGQLWGNPLYRWDVMARDGFAWWIERFRATFALFDLVRVDHFRGFASYWSVPAGETTAVRGEWLPGPGAPLFEALERAFGRLPILAENLGVITEDVESLRARFGLPGMAILQFAFGKDPQGPSFRPHNYPRELVAYTGTHDNDTTLGWWTSSAGTGSTRSEADILAERAFALRYLGSPGSDIVWDMIRAVSASVANTVLIPVQDVLGLGTEARMNRPATMSGNWKWRMPSGALTPAHAARLREMAESYDR